MRGRASRHSSTSSSDPRLARDILKTVLAVGAILLAAESAFRTALPHLSRNSRSLTRAPERAARLRATSDRPRVLILGNSVGREGIDAGLLGALLDGYGVDAHIEHQSADSSDMRDWTYLLENLFLDAGAIPDLLVLPVGNLHPLIREKAPSEDLLHYFLRFRDLPELFRKSDIRSPAAQAHIVLRKSLALYGFRGRLQKRMLTELFAGYPDLRRRLRSLRPDPGGEPRINTAWMERADALADAAGVRVVVVAMPTADLEGKLPPRDRRAAARLGWTVLETAPGPAFGEEDRPDGLHLTPEARTRFTALLAAPLAALASETLTQGTEPAPSRGHGTSPEESRRDPPRAQAAAR